WDVAAGTIMVQEAGGTVTSYDSAPLDMEIESASSILASNGALHTELLGLLRV
ncbi:MAG: inositol monophosphatase family protein, partial [Chloroflexota bacterium]